MKKSSLFISSVLTTFVLAVLAGVVTAYRSFPGINIQAVLQQPALAGQVSASSAILPQAAAQIAAQFIGRTDLYSAESVALNGTSAYKVTFSSGDVVYVSQQGQVLNVVQAPSTAANSNPPPLFEPNFGTGQEHGGGHGD